MAMALWPIRSVTFPVILFMEVHTIVSKLGAMYKLSTRQINGSIHCER